LIVEGNGQRHVSTFAFVVENPKRRIASERHIPRKLVEVFIIVSMRNLQRERALGAVFNNAVPAMNTINLL